MAAIARIRYEFQDDEDHIRVIDSFPENHRALHFEDSVQGVLNLSAHHEPVLEYICLMAEGARLFNPLPHSILLGGLGSCALLHAVSYWWKRTARIQTVEYSERIRDIARRYFRLRSSDEILLGDLRDILEHETLPPSDLIFVDCYSSCSIPPQLTTLEFMQLLFDQLTPDGAIAFNLWSPACNELCGDQILTMLQVFEKVALVECFDEQNMVAFVRKDPQGSWPGYLPIRNKRYNFRFLSKSFPKFWPGYMNYSEVITDDNVDDLFERPSMLI